VPSFLKKASIALGTLKDVAQGAMSGETVYASDEEKANRLCICKGCQHYIENMAGSPRCNECGCYMSLKASLNKAQCPIGKW
jgi:hypothetical protein